MRSVSSALRALLLLGESRELRLVDVSLHLGLGKSSAHRLLATLRSFGFVSQDPETRTYRIGPVLADLAAASSLDRSLVGVARQALEDLAHITRETANLIVLRGPDIVFLDGVEGHQQVRVASRTGDRVPAYSTAAGKVLLAEQSREEVYQLYPVALKRLTRRTHASPHMLAQELSAVRRLGFAINVDESLDGVSAVATKLAGVDGRAVAAVTVSLPTSRFSREIVPTLLRELDRTGLVISRALAEEA